MAETAGETSRLVTLTDGKQSKPLMVHVHKSSVSSLVKEGKNKFRRKYKFVVYQDQVIHTDEDLKLLLDNQEGPLTLMLTNKEPQEPPGEFAVAQARERGLSYIIGNENDVEQDAISQLKRASELDGCIFAAGMPDLHPGKGIPIGAVVMTNERIAYPQLVDNDIGCGMSFVETSLTKDKLNTNKLRKIAASLRSIDGPYAPAEEVIELCSQSLQWGTRKLEPLPKLTPSFHYENLGTVGGGNHFAELQQFDEIYDAAAIQQYGIDVNKIHLLVHSGSRSLGSQYLKEFCEGAAEAGRAAGSTGHYGVATDTPLFEQYLESHNVALNFAARNRQLIARRLLEQITGDEEPECKIDIYHNFMEKVEVSSLDAMREMADQGQFPKVISAIPKSENSECVAGWIHRKGATPTTQSRVLVIPGSRGSLSYLVEVNKDAEHGSGYSLAHGAGRRMNRSKALAKHKSQYPNARQLLQTDLGSIVICEKKDLVY